MADLAALLDDLGPATTVTGVTTTTDAVATVGPTDTVLPLASVTKPLAAYATLLAVDAGRVDLDEEVDDEGRTVRHLLAHASGLPGVGGGPRGAPGRGRVYSNEGFDVLGSHVADAVGRPFPVWLSSQLLVPLRMHDTTLDGSPAKDGTSTVDDLLRFARELLDPTLVDRGLGDELATAQWPELDGVLPGYGRQTPNPWGLGVEIRGAKDPHWTDAALPPSTFGHFGQSGSFLFVSRDDGVAAAFLCDEPFGRWAVDGWPAVTAELHRLGTQAA